MKDLEEMKKWAFLVVEPQSLAELDWTVGAIRSAGSKEFNPEAKGQETDEGVLHEIWETKILYYVKIHKAKTDSTSRPGLVADLEMQREITLSDLRMRLTPKISPEQFNKMMERMMERFKPKDA